MKNETETASEVSTKEKKITSSLLDAFDFLKSPKNDLKLNGGAKVISLLRENENDKEIHYTLKRLMRSLGANKPEMRISYFATLVSLLKNFCSITATQILDLVKKELHASGSSKSEVGDVALGQILVCSAIFRSGLMLKSTNEEQNQIIALLINASSKKSYLSIVAYLILLDFINTLNEEQFLSIVWSHIKKEFKKDLQEHNLDSLYFLMIVSKKFPDSVKLKKLLGVKTILCEDTVHTICEKLMAGIDFNSVNHPIYNEIGILIANSPHLQLFWTSGIDTQLVKHNRNRELVAINILNTILLNIKDNYEVLPELLSKNFFKLFLDWFKGLQTASKVRNKRDNEDDHKLMVKKQRELLNTLAKTLKNERVTSAIRIEILKKLLFHPGDMNFSEITGTSITKSIIADVDKNGVKKISVLFKEVLMNTSKKLIKDGVERNWFNNERLKAAETLSYLISHEAVKNDTNFKLNYMKMLMCYGFFKSNKDESVAISSELSNTIKSCFYRCLSSRYSSIDSLVEVLSCLCKFINEILEKDETRGIIEKKFPKENMEYWEMLTGISQNIEETVNISKVEKVFLILFYQLGLFLFSEPKHVQLATSSIKELKSCYEHYKKGKKKKANKIKADLTEEEPEWIEVLVEVLLSILSAESSVFRSVVQCVFRLLWEYLTPSSIGQIISVLDPENENNPLTDDIDQSDNESEISNEENDNANNKENKSTDECEDSDSDDDMNDDEDDMKTPDQLRLAIQKALGNAAAPDTDTESIDADMIDEEEGKKLDEALAEAFKQFHGDKNKNSKKERKDKKALSDFRIRVLDLIDIYLEKDPAMDITLGMIPPLIRCLEFCLLDNQFSDLEKRLRKTLKLLTKIKKFSSTDEVTMNVLCEYLNGTIDKGARSHFMFQALGDVITHCATFMIHCSQKIENKTEQCKEGASRFIQLFKDSVQNYFNNRNCLLPIIYFHNILQTDWHGTYDLMPIIIKNAFDKNVRQFRRNEAIDLMIGFYRSLKRIKPTSKEALNSLLAIEKLFDSNLRETLSGNQDEFIAKNNFFVSLNKLINTIRMYHESCQVQTNLDYKLLIQIVNSSKSTKKVSNNQFVTNIQNQQNGGIKKSKKNKLKRKVEPMNGHSESNSKGSKKKKNDIM